MEVKERTFLFVWALILVLVSGGCAAGRGKDTVYRDNGFYIFSAKDYQATLKETLPAASQGNAEAQFRLASMYQEGRGVAQNHREALRLFRAAAGQGHLPSQVNLGLIYAQGLSGIQKDQVLAWKWLAFAAAQGDVESRRLRDDLAIVMTPAQVEDAQRLVREFTPEDALTGSLREVLDLADRGIPEAQLKAGVMLYHGQGAPRDYREALRWFIRSGEKGNPYAQSNAGYMYEKGQGAPQDHTEAARWYLLAARQGNTFAQSSLGQLYEKGSGVKKDDVQALLWFSLAAAQGQEQAKNARDRLVLWLDPAQVAEAQRLARELTAGK